MLAVALPVPVVLPYVVELTAGQTTILGLSFIAVIIQASLLIWSTEVK